MYDTHELGGLKKVLKKIKKPLIIAAAATATYFTAGAAAPLLAKAIAKKKSGKALTPAEQLQVAMSGKVVDPATGLLITGSSGAPNSTGIPVPAMIAAGIVGLALLLRKR